MSRPSHRSLGGKYRKLISATAISNLGDGVSTIAYPWLASAVTRNPVLIALVAVAQRLPWLLFTLPAGVITDRADRRRLMVGANAARALLTFGVAVAVLLGGDGLPEVDALETVIGTDAALYIAVLVATLLLGMAEVLYDNSSQTFMPAIVAADDLERANGRMYSAEIVANQFAGPPLGSVLLAIGFAVPFFLDAASFAASAALVFAIAPVVVPRPRVEAAPGSVPAEVARPSWRSELVEGLTWLWRHPLLRPMAIILGLMNGLGQVAIASIVLFGQEILGTSATEFAIMFTGAAVGGLFGGWTASAVSRALGSGPALWMTLAVMAATSLVIGIVSSWPIVWVMLAGSAFVALVWNVITVSLRQTIIPDRLLGRVNSVYRFFAWGMLPIGALVGGLIVSVTERFASRELALRMPWFVAAGGYVLLLTWAMRTLTTERMDAARAAGPAPLEPGGSEVVLR